ncbi:MAG: polyphosphate kinase 2 family protein [Acidimicrobiia bacterium]|nr:polyphosphate kinase 2 family protein [Acidimicrobiia bacterium]
MDINDYRIAPGDDVDLSRWATGDDGGLTKDEGRKRFDERNERLEVLQELLYADGSQKLLVVLQATDTGGKDGTIRRVTDGLNPQGVKVASFKKPTELELAHDYLWRVHAHMPRSGEMTIFNRSHYEDVLVVRVHGLVPEDRWSKRYGQIRAFEQMLADEGTTIVKLFLHISEHEQAERLQARLDDPAKHWKFSLGDLDERKRWDDYQEAFRRMLAETSTADAPWYVIPADRKWYRDLVVAHILVQTLEGLDLAYPPNVDDLSDVVIT